MLNLNSVMLGSENPLKLAEFYEKVLEVKPDWEEGDWRSFQAGSSWLVIGPHDKVKGTNPQPERVILNFETDDVRGEFARVKALGAKVIAEPYRPMQVEDKDAFLIATFADPDGNYFQLAAPWK